MAGLDIELVRHALGVARRHGFAEVELSVGEDVFSAKLDPQAPKVTAASAPSDTGSTEPEFVAIKSTLVGFYREAKTPLAVGSTVKKGDVVAVIAALGIANDVESKVTGEVVEVLVEVDQPVEFNQVLARVRPAEVGA
jgi:biotin carboxyl carrier protein